MVAKPDDLVPSGAGLAGSVAIESRGELGELEAIDSNARLL